MHDKNIACEQAATDLVSCERQDRVALLCLNRPTKGNSLNAQLVKQLARQLATLDDDNDISVIVISGHPRFFSAGADVREMVDLDLGAIVRERFPGVDWECISRTRKPVIAAVSGLAMGGGCEFVQACDVVIAGESARFGQPEIALGTIPGLGGTQRLPRLIGRIRAMDWCLRARTIDAQEALLAGMVTQVVADDDVVAQALAYAREVARFSLPVLTMLKEAINQTQSLPLEAGLAFEKRQFHATFALHDCREGMAAFIQKRTPAFRNA